MDKFTIQEAINWIEGNLDEATLKKISSFLGYSEFHTSREFKKYTESTLRNYLMLRRLSRSAKDLRDKDIRIIDCAVKHGFHTQESFTKSFQRAFGITPGEYKKTLRAIPLTLKKDVLYPDFNNMEGEIIMVKDEEIKISMHTVPEHKFFYLERQGVDNYIDFWDQMDKEGYDCNRIHGLFASIKGIYEEGYGAFTKRGYIFGKDAPLEYELNEPGIKTIIIPEQKCLIFEHPGFTEAQFHEALSQVRRVSLEKFDFKVKDYTRDTSFVKAYEHSGMEICFYFVRIPLK